MSRGEIAQIGTPKEIYFEPASRFVAEFVGAANIVEGPILEQTIVVPGGRLGFVAEAPAGAATAMIRPEAIAVVEPESANLRGEVEAVSFLGDRQRLTIVGAFERPATV